MCVSMGLKGYLDNISKLSLEEYFSNFGEIEQKLMEAEQLAVGRDETAVKQQISLLRDEMEIYPVWMRIHIYSFFMKLCNSPVYTEKLLDEVINADYDAVGEYNKLSHYWQISSHLFTNKEAGSAEVNKKLAALYRSLKECFQSVFGIQKRAYIPAGQRDKNLVFVFTSQMLGLGHAPTKTVLDRCYVLQKFLKKKVHIIINTAMFMPVKGQAPFYRLECGAYEESLSDVHEIAFKGEKFSFFQCKNEMPDLGVIQALLNRIREVKPYYIIQVGGNDICADICGMLVPQITISTVFSGIATSCGEYQLVDKALNEGDVQVLQILGVEPQKVKRAMFTFSFKAQSHHFSREELGLWKDYFILIVVGWRLDEEIDEAFIKMLCRVIQCEEKLGVAFAGKFDNYNLWIKKYPVLEQSSRNLGAQSDVLAVLECCDLYANPRRNGGGSSVAEALFKGVPAVTLPVGDVSVAAGEEFWVADYEAMEKQIYRYCTDSDFYGEMQEKAKQRAEKLLDSEGGFGKAMQEIEAEIEGNA